MGSMIGGDGYFHGFTTDAQARAASIGAGPSLSLAAASLQVPAFASGMSVELVAICAVTVFSAYFIFGLTGFGSSLLSVPVLSQFVPLAFLLPVCLTLDFAASLQTGWRSTGQPDRQELVWTLPPTLVGTVAGVLLLVYLSERLLLGALGVFTLGYGLYLLSRLRAGGAALAPVSRWWALPAGGAGGLMGSTFGVPGPPYVIYLTRRISDTQVFQATLARVFVAHFFTRIVVFAVAGLYAQPGVWQAIAVLLPLSMAGVWVGMHVQLRLSQPVFFRVIACLLLVIGGALCVRVFA
jgi:uncharacterized protein